MPAFVMLFKNINFSQFFMEQNFCVWYKIFRENRKLKKVSIVLCISLLLASQSAFAAAKGEVSAFPVREFVPIPKKKSAIVRQNTSVPKKTEEYTLKLNENEKNKIKLTPENTYQKDELIIKDRQLLETLISEQQRDEIKDIELLWESTVNNNELIKFTMNKLNTPDSQKRLHSSIMAKTLSAIIYGASFLPTFTGSNALIQSAAFTSGRLANNYLNRGSTAAAEATLSDTELIQLAGTIEELQDLIISIYYNYKGSLNKLKDTRNKLILYNKNYSTALSKNDEVEIAVSSALYEDTRLEELRLEEEAKKYCLSLERLAGKKAVDDLILSQYALNNKLFNDSTFDKD